MEEGRMNVTAAANCPGPLGMVRRPPAMQTAKQNGCPRHSASSKDHERCGIELVTKEGSIDQPLIALKEVWPNCIYDPAKCPAGQKSVE
jgi:hypothetical protein